MEKKPGSKEIRRWCTGMTVSEVKEEIKAFRKGRKAPKKCYLCKRPEGSKSVVLTANKREPYVLAKIALLPVQRKITRDWVFDYFPCWECAVLVGFKPKSNGERKRAQSEGPAQFLPAGPAPDYYS